MTKENLFTPNSIRTNSGLYLDVINPTPDMINIKDIVHALSFQCRFGGHLDRFYSVAEHSLNCYYLNDNRSIDLEVLMHDASEAYLLDMPRPIKQNLPDYKILEDRLMKVIAEKYGFAYPMSKEVKDIDNLLLQIEWDTLMLKGTNSKLQTYTDVRKRFLREFHELTNNKFI